MAKKLAFDKLLLTTVAGLVAVGLALVYSASGALVRDASRNPFLLKQAFAAGLGFTAMAVLMRLDYRSLDRRRVVYPLLLVAAVLLVAVLFYPPVSGGRRWILLGPFSFQPSELAKLALVVFIAFHAARKEGDERRRELLLVVLVVAGLLAGLVYLEPDLGTVVLLGAVTVAMLTLAGVPWRDLGTIAAVGLVVVALLIAVSPYRRERLAGFLDPDAEPLGSGYQVRQSLIAVGSGGLTGRGPGNSLQKLYFLPQAHTDFVYSIAAEEMGLVGASGILALFGVLFWRGVRAGWRVQDAFGRHLAWGITFLIALQALINVSVVLRLLPATGLPLPLVSYGGSSLLVTLAACGLLLNVSEHA